MDGKTEQTKDFVRYERDGKVVTLTLDDGKANALGPDMVASINAALDRVEAEEGVRVVVLAGRPGRFCAGFDLKVISRGREHAEPLVRAGCELFLRLYGFGRPLLAACTGHALAGGAVILLCCDARIGTEGQFKLGLNEVAIGIELPSVVRRLAADRLDTRRQCEAALLGTIYPPQDAREVGFLDEVVPEASFSERIKARARELSRLPPGAFRRSKALVRGPSIEYIRGSLDDDLDRILALGGPPPPTRR